MTDRMGGAGSAAAGVSAGTVATVLTPPERARVDAVGAGIYRALHRDTLDDVIRDLRERRVRAVLVSVACCRAQEAGRVAAMVREFPRVPAVALLTEVAAATPHTVLSLGRSGVRALVDARQPAGWRALRTALLNEQADGIERRAVAQLAQDLPDAPDDCRRVLELFFTCEPGITAARQLAAILGVGASTLLSRFYRAGLPAPKRYLVMARLTRAARLLENGGLSVANVADRMEYSSPQSFGRHVRATLGLTAQRFRETYDGEGMLDRFRAELVLPFTDVLREFRPLGKWGG